MIMRIAGVGALVWLAYVWYWYALEFELQVTVLQQQAVATAYMMKVLSGLMALYAVRMLIGGVAVSAAPSSPPERSIADRVGVNRLKSSGTADIQARLWRDQKGKCKNPYCADPLFSMGEVVAAYRLPNLTKENGLYDPDNLIGLCAQCGEKKGRVPWNTFVASEASAQGGEGRAARSTS